MGGGIQAKEVAGGRVINVQLLGIMSSASVLGGPRPAAAGKEGGRTWGDVTTWGSPLGTSPKETPMPPWLCKDVGIVCCPPPPPPTRWNPQAMGARCGCKPTPSPSAPRGAHGLHPHAGEERVVAHPHGSSCLPAPQLGLEQPERVW